ncbi:uncharacterized protein LOC133293277 isoform X2 [Gastrolobium bilobum]|uniref:uncharacterized protein LOC133293277 isoform X2 n=1 Tax=Gastrolobium bilobum TaxID=150636 RepID=UPI002AB0EEC3|nr:uncharacterized protein LOC133293277 isoform X2 [Gastrolobium bilobum]
MGQRVLEPRKNYMGDAACGMKTLKMEQVPLSGRNEDEEVDIIGCTNSGKALVVEDSCEDVTEGSSSFGDTGSGSENASYFSDAEVESRMRADNASSSMCDDDWSELIRPRKKKVTVHWRSFIRPIMWHCKWIELQLRQLQSQALKYEKELAAYNYRKQLDFSHLTLDDSGIKSMPISGRMHRNKVMRRTRRKRVEEKCDLASYMSKHSLFSHEKTDSSVDACSKYFPGVAIGDNKDINEEFKWNFTSSSVDYENDNKSFDYILKKIEAAKSQLNKLKTRLDNVVSENPGNFCSVTQLNMGDQHQSEFHMRDQLMSVNASSSHQGIIVTRETTDRPEFDDPWEDTKDGVIRYQAAMKEVHGFENIGNQAVEGNKSISQVQVSEPDLATENNVPNFLSTLKSCPTLKSYVPRNKRNGRKKSGSKGGSIWLR